MVTGLEYRRRRSRGKEAGATSPGAVDRRLTRAEAEALWLTIEELEERLAPMVADRLASN
jgi:hypothetical protein